MFGLAPASAAAAIVLALAIPSVAESSALKSS